VESNPTARELQRASFLRFVMPFAPPVTGNHSGEWFPVLFVSRHGTQPIAIRAGAIPQSRLGFRFATGLHLDAEFL
jgi:hypothetical protein